MQIEITQNALYPWLKEGTEIGEIALKPILTFILKIESMCNLNCTYCYMYNLADQNWKHQPKKMTKGIYSKTATRIKEHIDKHCIEQINVIFHGGEPMLVGVPYIREIVQTCKEIISNVKINFGMQTNATLINAEWIDFLKENNMSLGISIDGSKKANDKYRIYENGKSSFSDLITGIDQLQKAQTVPYGFLCVIDIENDPIEVYDFLCTLKPTALGFLFPLNHHDNFPKGKSKFSAEHTEYADWLIPIFEKWYNGQEKVQIRLFEDIMALTLGGSSFTENIGVSQIDLIVVEANGEIEGVDSLKSTFEGATKLGLNIFDNNFEDVIRHPAYYSRQLGIRALCETCQQCCYVKICGAGYLPERFSKENGFVNQTIYCYDLMKLIKHIRHAIMIDLKLNQ
jgi:uncharacterized protein